MKENNEMEKTEKIKDRFKLKELTIDEAINSAIEICSNIREGLNGAKLMNSWGKMFENLIKNEWYFFIIEDYQKCNIFETDKMENIIGMACSKPNYMIINKKYHKKFITCNSFLNRIRINLYCMKGLSFSRNIETYLPYG